MPLPKPRLDVRTFDQLVAEQRGQLPRLAASLTDYNFSDPGMTLLDLAAWLAEQAFFRFDRVSPEMLRAFLRLVGVTPRPPETATTVVLIATTGGVSVPLPDRTQFAAQEAPVVFESVAPLVVSPATLVRVMAGEPPTDVTAANFAQYEPLRDDTAGTFLPFGSNPVPGAMLMLGFDQPLGVPGSGVSLHSWTTTPERDARTRAALVADWEERTAVVERDCPAIAHALANWRRHYSVRTTWEYRNAIGWWPLPDVDDETRALSLSGFVRFTVPGDHAAGPGAHFWIRCRLLRGAYECAPRLDRIGINAARVEHAESLPAPELLGDSRGHAQQAYLSARAPIVPASTTLTFKKGSAIDGDWREVVEWDEIGAHDRAYRVDYEAGRITFGDGLRGAAAPDGWTVHLDYRVGAGETGNVPADLLVRIPSSVRNISRVANWAVVGSTLSVLQPYRSFGGDAAETLAHAQARALETLAAPQKAVTAVDFSVLARRTPGVPVGRAYAVAEHHPALPCVPALGSVTVIVVPDCPHPRPVPTTGLLRAVGQYLERRRLVTTEVHVVAPHYVGVIVSGTLHVTTQGAPATLRAAAQRALDAFFHPLTGGPDGRGWPAGRGVYRTEIMALLVALPFVERVTGLGLLVEGEPAPRCVNVEVCATDLIASGRHQFEIRLDPAARPLRRSVEHECP